MARHSLIQCDLCGEVITHPGAEKFSVAIRWETFGEDTGVRHCKKKIPVTLGELCLACLEVLEPELHSCIAELVEEHTKTAAGELPYRVIDRPSTGR